MCLMLGCPGVLEQNGRQGETTGVLLESLMLSVAFVFYWLLPHTQGTAHTQDVPIALGPMLSCPSGLQAPFAPEVDLEPRIPVK